MQVPFGWCLGSSLQCKCSSAVIVWTEDDLALNSGVEYCTFSQGQQENMKFEDTICLLCCFYYIISYVLINNNWSNHLVLIIRRICVAVAQLDSSTLYHSVDYSIF